MTSQHHDDRLRRLATGVCTFRECDRKAMRGHLMCKRHGSAGRLLNKGERAEAKDLKL